MNQRLHRRFIPWILYHAFEFKWHYLGAVLCLFILQNLQVLIPSKIRTLTQNLSDLGNQSFSVWIFVGLAIGILVFRTLSRLMFFYPARVQQKNIRYELLNLIERTPPSRYAKWSAGQLYQVLFDDINNLRAFIGFGLLQIGNLIITTFVLVPKINETDAYLWPAFTPLLFSVVLFSVMTFVNEKIYKKMMDKKGEVQQNIIEAYSAKQTIKNFHREEKFIERFINLSKEELGLFFKSSLGYAFIGPYIKLGLGASLLWAAVLIKARGGSPSDLVFFAGFLYLFLEPVMFLSWVAVVVSQGFAAWRRVKELVLALNTTSETEERLKSADLDINQNRICLKLPYWDTTVNLSFSQGGWSALIGETGCGKSQLLSKIATTMNFKDQKVSMVQQEPYLFNDTIAENIFLGQTPDSGSLDLAIELIKIFQIDGLASSPKEVLNIEVGENGKRLSGGQIKRVSLIRSLMSGANILIWDDPFSSVDIILEKKIIKTLRTHERWKNLTFIISSHRLTTVRLSDQLIFLDPLIGIKTSGPVQDSLKEEYVFEFFKEQLVALPLA